LLNILKSLNLKFETDGYVIIDSVASDAEVESVEANLSSIVKDGVGTRNLLQSDWCQQMAQRLKHDLQLSTFLTADTVAVQCTYFSKSENENWLVALHRDYSIPVKNRVQSEEWSRWSEKEGVLFVRPPRKVLEALVAVRIHLEDNTEKNGPLQVVPGSHLSTGELDARVFCKVRRGGALVMRPLILHASSKLEEGSRRVLHFVYGPKLLPDRVEWAQAI
jgi:hypothetical protein